MYSFFFFTHSHCVQKRSEVKSLTKIVQYLIYNNIIIIITLKSGRIKEKERKRKYRTSCIVYGNVMQWWCYSDKEKALGVKGHTATGVCVQFKLTATESRDCPLGDYKVNVYNLSGVSTAASLPLTP